MPQVLRILHTADLHGRTSPEWEARIQELKEGFQPDLLLDSGDACKAGNLGVSPSEPTLQTLSRLNYTAMVLGNRETHLWKSLLAKKIRDACFPVLCTNLEVQSPPSPVKKELILNRKELQIALLGLTVPMVTRKQWVHHLCDLWFEDPVKVAQETVPLLRPKVDLVILLSHLGLQKEQELARVTPGIDLILGGHTHTVTPEPLRVGETYIQHSGYWGRTIGLLQICFEREPERRIKIKGIEDAGVVIPLSPSSLDCGKYRG